MKKITTLLLYCLIGAYSSIYAQGSIQGRLLDENGQSMPFANVLLMNAADSTLVKGMVTDTSGVFIFEKIPTGRYYLNGQMIGYTPWVSEVFTYKGEGKTFPEVQLFEESTHLGEVVVTADKPLLQITPAAMVVNVSSSPVMQNGTVQDVLEKSPGISVDQNGNISLKGKANVLIYIDGKQTFLSAADLARLLQSTPAEDIEKVEIMDTPPAKYDAAGNAGIINIVRKKDASQGMNGTASINLGQGRYPKVIPSLNLNYRKGKLALFGNYSFNYSQRFNDMYLDRQIPFAEANTFFDQSNERVNWVRAHNFRTGGDWLVGKRTTIGAMVSGNAGNWSENGFIDTKLSGQYPNPFDQLRANNESRNQWNNLTYNLNLKQDIGKSGELILDADLSQWNNDNNQLVENQYFLNSGAQTDQQYDVSNQSSSDIDIIAVKADYSTTLLEKYQFETGAKASIVTADNQLRFFEDVGDGFLPDTRRSNAFEYEEQISAAYMNINRKLGEKWSVQAGLRGEHTYSKGYSVTLDSTVKLDYFNLFPSMALSYNQPEKFSLSASYSRRVDRPDYGDLNPFEFFLDQFTFGRGNPFLRPQFSDTYGLTYGWKDMVFVTLNYTDTRDAISEVLLQDDELQITYQTTVNLNRIRNYSVNLAAPLNIADWWVMNLNLTAFRNHITSPLEGSEVNQKMYSYNSRINNTFSLPKGVKLELTGFYQSKMIWGIMEMAPQYQIDFGVAKTFGALNARLSWSDVFDTRDFRGEVVQGNVNTRFGGKWESSVVRLNLSYRFGNSEVKGARRRGTASDDINQRAGSD